MTINVVTRQMLFYGLGLALMKGVSLLMLPVITRYLSPTEYGILDVLLTWMNVLGIILGFGMADILYRFCSDQNTAFGVYNTLLKLHLWLIVPVLLLSSLVLFFFENLLPQSITLTLTLTVILASGLASYMTLPLCWLRMQDRADWFFYCTAGKALLQASLCWLLLNQGLGVAGVLYASVISHLFLIILIHFLLRPSLEQRKELGMSQQQTRTYLHYGMPLVLSGLCLFLVCGAERWIIAGVLKAEDLAHYAVASQFALMVAVFTEPFTLWWFPKRLRMLKHYNGIYHIAQSAVFGCILSMASAVAIATVGPIVIEFLLPEPYHMAAKLLPLLCLAMVLKQCSHILNCGCYSGNNTHTVGKINGALAIVAPIVYFAGCILGGLDGLLYALLIIYSLRLIWFFKTSQRLLLLPYPLRRFTLSLGSTAIMLAITPTLSFSMLLIIASAVLTSLVILALPLARSMSNANLNEVAP